MAIKLDYAVQESLQNLRRNLFMSFAAVLVVVLALYQFGAVFLLRQAAARTSTQVTRNVEVAVFLSNDISPDQREALQRELKALPIVRLVTFESRAQAYESFRRLFADEPEVVQNVTPDALPESFRVKLRDPTRFDEIKDRFDGRSGIQEIRDEEQTLRLLFQTTRAVQKGGAIMAIAVGISALVLIATTIQVAIFARRKEIGIMKLVGATNWFVRVPFMLEGVVQGVIGAVIAAMLLLPSRGYLAQFGPSAIQSEQLRFQILASDVLSYGVLALVMGILLGALGSLAGLRRFLDV